MILISSYFCVNANNGLVHYIGYIFILTAMLIFLLLMVSSECIKIESIFIRSFLAVFAVYTIGLMQSFTVRGIRNYLLMYSSFFCIVVASTFAKEIITFFYRISSKMILPLAVAMMLPMFCGYGINPMDQGYKSFFSTTTFLGIFATMLVEICLLLYSNRRSKSYLLSIVLLVYMVYKSRVRTAYVGIVLIFIMSFLLLHTASCKKRKKVSKIFKILCYLSMFAFIMIYPVLDTFEIYDRLAELTYQYTGKILLTGRNIIWKDAFAYIMRRPVWGYGLDYNKIDVLSIHNSYLNCILQLGFCGLAAVLTAINTVISKIENAGTMACSLISCFSLVNLVMCLNEVMLFQGQIVLQTIIWSIMGIGIGLSRSPV